MPHSHPNDEQKSIESASERALKERMRTAIVAVSPTVGFSTQVSFDENKDSTR